MSTILCKTSSKVNILTQHSYYLKYWNTLAFLSYFSSNSSLTTVIHANPSRLDYCEVLYQAVFEEFGNFT